MKIWLQIIKHDQIIQVAPDRVKVAMKRLTPPKNGFFGGGSVFLGYILMYVSYDPNFVTNVNYKVEDTF